MPSVDWTSIALEPLATSASVVRNCSTSRLADIPGTETFPPPQVEPLMEKSWHSSTGVLPKSSDSNAVYALHADGTGEAPQLSAAFWVFVAFVRMVSQSDAFNDVVKTLDGVRVATPADAAIS